MGGDCSFDGCSDPVEKGGYCAGHRKQRQRGQTMTPLAKRPATALERLTEAAIDYAEADDDDDYRRAKDSLRKAAKAYSGRAHSEAIRAGLAERRARGDRVGPVPKPVPACDELSRLVQEAGPAEVARQLNVSRVTVWRALRRCCVVFHKLSQ